MATPYALRAFEGWLTRTRNSWRSASVFAVAGPLLYLAAMGSGLGSIIGRNEPAALEGLAYGDFVAPGLLAAAAMQTAMSESTWTVMGAVKWDRSYHAMLSSPLSVADVLHGHLLLVATRIALGCVAFAAAAVLLGYHSDPLGLLAVPVAVLTGVAFAAPLMAWSVGRQTNSAFSIVFRVVMMPLFMFSGTFFPLSCARAEVRCLTSIFLQKFGLLNKLVIVLYM